MRHRTPPSEDREAARERWVRHTGHARGLRMPKGSHKYQMTVSKGASRLVGTVPDGEDLMVRENAYPIKGEKPLADLEVGESSVCTNRFGGTPYTILRIA